MAGFTAPAIFLPSEGTLSGASIYDILLHELSHIKRHDNIWKLAQHALIAFIPFQPLLWIFSKWIEETSDLSCDDYVIKHTSSRYDYANGLFRLACQYNPVWRDSIAGVGFLSFKLLMVRRIKRILDKQRIIRLEPGKKFIFCVSCICIFSVFLAGMIVVREEAFALMNQSFIVPVFAFMNKKTTASSPLRENETILSKSDTRNFTRKPEKTVKTENIIEAKMETVFNTISVYSIKNDVIHEKFDSISAHNTSFPNERNSEPIPSSGRSAYENHNGFESILTVKDSSQTTLENQIDTYLNNAQSSSNVALFITGVKENRIKMPAAKVVNVQVTFDYRNFDFDLNNKDDRRLYNLYQSLDKNKNEPAWSPDGKWIAFTDHNRIWVVSSGGGEPRLVYEDMQYGYSVGNFESLCFTTDSNEITFKKDVYDVTKGSIIETYEYSPVTEQSYVNNPVYYGYAIFRNPVQNIESVNIYSQEHRVVVEEGRCGAWSHSGRYLCYLTWTPQTGQNASLDGLPVLYDTLTGEKIFLSQDTDKHYGSPTFSPDDSHIVIPVRDNLGPIELYKIPLDGGQPEQLTIYTEDETHGKYCNFPEYSPDGKWVLYTDFTWCENKPDKRLFVYNIMTRDLYEVFENAYYPNSFGKWSPDGTKVCYLSEENDGNYIYICDFYPEALSKAVNTEKTKPIPFQLEGNYPNPFNVSTTIEFSIPKSGPVTLEIFNISGQKVVELVNDHITSGKHAIVWNGYDDNGNRAASGIYISRLRFNGHFLTNRMTLLK